ncbi:MAG TPA: YafY family protein [Blastocatellia bacterium]|jgi:predicted DNA-binding transcriptional regulator YafY
MRADRLLSIMLTLQVHGRITARELARRMEVSERTIHRDMDALSAAGVPVFAERGAGGGWALVEEYRTNLTGLSRPEIQALFLTKPSRLLADLGLEKASDAAFIKLLASLPSMYRADAEYVRQRIHIDPTGWAGGDEAAPFLQAIQRGIWQERKLVLTYGRHGCEPVERTVDPLGLVAKGSVWYLVAACDGQVRSYRVSRVLGVEVTAEPSVRPRGFDLAAHWEESTSEFKQHLPRYNVRARVSPRVLPRIGFAGRFAKIEHIGPRDDQGWAEVSIRFDAEEVAWEYMLGFGPQVEVIEPGELRYKVIEKAKEVIAFYDRKAPEENRLKKRAGD